jgi:DNA polymerase-4
MVAKVSSDQAKPNGVLWIQPGLEAEFLAPLDVRRIPGVGKVMEKRLAELGIRKVGDLARLDQGFLVRRFGQWGLALAGKARGSDAGAWFDSPVGDGDEPKSVSHEHTFGEDTADETKLDSTLAHLTEKVARRLREYGLHARTVHLKLRDSSFETITRAHTLKQPTQVDQELIVAVRGMFREAWVKGTKIRLIGAGVSGLDAWAGQLDLLDAGRHDRAMRALEAADSLRKRFGEKSVSLAAGMTADAPERVHENPAGLPGKRKGVD